MRLVTKMMEFVRSSESILVIWMLVRSPDWPTTLEGLLVVLPFRFGDLGGRGRRGSGIDPHEDDYYCDCSLWFFFFEISIQEIEEIFRAIEEIFWREEA